MGRIDAQARNTAETAETAEIIGVVGGVVFQADILMPNAAWVAEPPEDQADRLMAAASQLRTAWPPRAPAPVAGPAPRGIWAVPGGFFPGWPGPTLPQADSPLSDIAKAGFSSMGMHRCCRGVGRGRAFQSVAAHALATWRAHAGVAQPQGDKTC